uniref:Ionotropic receptor n=1 Tax=Stomoxys calcitrans TaxID=35570 RepID=A0A1I8Q9F5_STOCA
MYRALSLMAVLYGAFLRHCISSQRIKTHSVYFPNTSLVDPEFDYESLLNAIQQEKSFDSVLLLHQPSHHQGKMLEIFLKYQAAKMPKLIIEGHDLQLRYMAIFNSEILAVVLTTGQMDERLMHTLAQTMDYMRQTRILMVATNISDINQFKDNILKLCDNYRMTNVIMSLQTSNHSKHITTVFHKLKPYPSYHWQRLTLSPHNKDPFYPQEWLNLQNRTLVTYPDQFPPISMVFYDHRGKLQISGYAGLLVLAFAQHYNANLQYIKPLEEGKWVHFFDIANMVADGLLDLPMSVIDTISVPMLNMSCPVVVNKSFFMVPLSTPFTIREIFTLLMNGYFFGSIIVMSLLLSIVHTLTDLFFEGTLEYMNFLINSKVMPGVLGQSFVERVTKLIGLRMIYFFIGFVGLNISTQFSANIHSLFTSPPYHRQLEKLSDLEHSPVKILMEKTDATLLYEWVGKHRSIVTITENSTFFVDAMRNLNTSYGYIIESELWDMYNRRQEYFRRKVFHIPPGMRYIDMLHWNLRLQYNSVYKEAIDQFIYRAYETGLMNAWMTQTYLDMSKMKRVPMYDPYQQKQSGVLRVNDFFWVWILLVIGLFDGFVVFLMELLIHHCCLKN